MINIHQHRIKNISFVLLLIGLSLMPLTARTATPDIKFVAQGEKWADAERKSFYSQDQDSPLMPLKWFQALKQANGELFISNSLKRYGYLPNDASPTPGLPVGFTVSKETATMST